MFYVGDLTYPPWREKDFDLNRFSYEWELLWIFEFNSNNGKYGDKRGRGVKSFPELVMIVMQQRENYPRKHIAFSSQLFNAQLLLSKHFTVQTKDAGCAKTEVIEVAKYFHNFSMLFPVHTVYLRHRRYREGVIWDGKPIFKE